MASLLRSLRPTLGGLASTRFLSTIRPHLGGGTILAARWRHRLSLMGLDQLNRRNTASTSPAMPSMRHVSRVSALAIRASSSASPALN